MASEWLPIETAPRDGSAFLAYYPEGEVYVSDETDELVVKAIIATVTLDERGYFHGNTYFITPDGAPTHWMPLPPAPGAA